MSGELETMNDIVVFHKHDEPLEWEDGWARGEIVITVAKASLTSSSIIIIHKTSSFKQDFLIEKFGADYDWHQNWPIKND